jgi:hypothetical protein
MKLGSLLGVALCSILFFSEAIACECASSFLDASSARKQQNVFAFRVLSMEFVPERGDGRPGRKDRINGKIQVIDSIRGDGKQFTSARARIWTCCGLRLQPGLIYWAFTSQKGPVLVVHQGNLLQLPPYFHESSLDISAAVLVRSMLQGKEGLGQFPEELWVYSDRTLAVAPPHFPHADESECPPTWTGPMRQQRPTPPPGSRTPAPATSTPRPRN